MLPFPLQLDLDLYYLVIKCYKERNAYPPRVSVDFKRAVRRLAETVVLRDGRLFGNVGKAAGRLIIMKERERFCLLRKAHAKGGEEGLCISWLRLMYMPGTCIYM